MNTDTPVSLTFITNPPSSTLDPSDIHISEVPFLVVDVETTGPSGRDNRITEIACIVVRDGEIVEEFSSLVNPRQHIPGSITHITGINDAMVVNAPETHDVMRSLRPLFAQPYAVFVAHNVAFDWSFVSNSFVRSNLPIADIPRLCTYKISKRLFPKRTKLNLSALSSYFDIAIKNRHRAHGDAFATAHVLVRMLEILQEQFNVQTLEELLSFQNKRLEQFKKPPKSIQALQERLRELPDEPGVYYFRDEHDTLLYIGKAKSLKSRVGSYFLASAQHTAKIKELVKQVRDVQWQTTGTELSALLLESKEIKTHTPRYNTLIKKYRRYPFLRLGAPLQARREDGSFSDTLPRLDICFEINDDGAEYFGPFGSRGSAEAIIEMVNRTFKLRKCTEPITISPDFSPCFYHQIDRCGAPCAELQPLESYEQEVLAVRRFLSGEQLGVVAALKVAMQESSQRLEFEDAALLRNRMKELERVFFRQRQISSSINENNVIIVLPTQDFDKKVEVFFIRHGRLKFQRLIGKKLPMKELAKMLEHVYTDASAAPKHCAKEEIDEIRIIASWVYQHRASGMFLYVEKQEISAVQEKLETMLYQALSTPPRSYEAAEEAA
ncbi:MAG: DEDD exnuclease domain-containing protein [Candidatus Kapaibacterium sp.]|nr:MAG: DEDD exnuclease domain-containing protein [Candidatus Kapabacteria bacterium]